MRSLTSLAISLAHWISSNYVDSGRQQLRMAEAGALNFLTVQGRQTIVLHVW